MNKIFEILENILFPMSMYRLPKNGEVITFIESDAPHKSTAYNGMTGKVETCTQDGFAIVSESGGILMCVVGRKQTSKVSYKKDGISYTALLKH